MKKFKSLITILTVLFATQVWAADFTIQLQPASNSVSDPQVVVMMKCYQMLVEL